MRSWVPWSLLAVLAVIAVTSAVVGATTDHAQRVQYDLVSPFYTPLKGEVHGVFEAAGGAPGYGPHRLPGVVVFSDGKGTDVSVK